MHKKVIYIIGIVFLSVGLLLGAIGAGIAVWRSMTIADAVPVTATIVAINIHRELMGNEFEWTAGDRITPLNTGRAFVEYEFNGIVITSSINWYHTGMAIGQSVDILVCRENPHRTFSPGIIGWLPTLILSGIGLIFGVLGTIFLIVEKRKQRLHHWLLNYGVPVWADVQGTEPNFSIQINGRPATVLVATFNNLRFTSGPINNNDLLHIEERVKIFIHPDDADKYTFDFIGESQREPQT